MLGKFVANINDAMSSSLGKHVPKPIKQQVKGGAFIPNTSGRGLLLRNIIPQLSEKMDQKPNPKAAPKAKAALKAKAAPKAKAQSKGRWVTNEHGIEVWYPPGYDPNNDPNKGSYFYDQMKRKDNNTHGGHTSTNLMAYYG